MAHGDRALLCGFGASSASQNAPTLLDYREERSSPIDVGKKSKLVPLILQLNTGTPPGILGLYNTLQVPFPHVCGRFGSPLTLQSLRALVERTKIVGTDGPFQVLCTRLISSERSSCFGRRILGD